MIVRKSTTSGILIHQYCRNRSTKSLTRCTAASKFSEAEIDVSFSLTHRSACWVPFQLLLIWVSTNLRLAEKIQSRASIASATSGHRNNTAAPTVRPMPQPRRAEPPTTAPSAAHASTVVTTGVPSTMKPTVDAAIAPAMTARRRLRAAIAAIGTTAITSSAPPRNGRTWLMIESTSVRSASTTASASSPARNGPLRDRPARCIAPAYDPLMAQNVLGGELEPCSFEPLTGFYRDGCCDTGGDDDGVHTVCAVMTSRVPRLLPRARERPQHADARPRIPRASWPATAGASARRAGRRRTRRARRRRSGSRQPTPEHSSGASSPRSRLTRLSSRSAE